MSLHNLAVEQPFPESTPEQDWAATLLHHAIDALKAPYPLKRMIRRQPGNNENRRYRPIKPAELATERREFKGNFISALNFIFGEHANFELYADALQELDAEIIRRGAAAILERRRYATTPAGRSDYLPERLRALWRAHKRRMNFETPRREAA